MPSYGMLRRVAIVNTDVSEEHIASIIVLILHSVLQLLVTDNLVSNSFISPP
jgi:hypothetical protein